MCSLFLLFSPLTVFLCITACGTLMKLKAGEIHSWCNFWGMKHAFRFWVGYEVFVVRLRYAISSVFIFTLMIGDDVAMLASSSSSIWSCNNGQRLHGHLLLFVHWCTLFCPTTWAITPLEPHNSFYWIRLRVELAITLPMLTWIFMVSESVLDSSRMCHMHGTTPTWSYRFTWISYLWLLIC